MRTGLCWIVALLIGSCVANNGEDQAAGAQIPIKESREADQPAVPAPALPEAPHPPDATKPKGSLQAGTIQPLGDAFALLSTRYDQVLRPLDAPMASRLQKVGYPGQYYYGIRIEDGDTALIATLEDETEWRSIHLFTLQQGQAVASLLVAQATESENGYTHTQAQFESDSTLRVITYRGAKDFGNHQTWDRDTIVNTYWLTPQGMIRKQE